MKNIFPAFYLLLFGCIGLFSCERPQVLQEFSVLTTRPIFNISTIAAHSGGDITSAGTGNPSITARGVCWNTVGNPTINDTKSTDGIGTGSFYSLITGLSPNTTYYVRAYATTGTGTGYGNERSFTTTTTVSPNDLPNHITTVTITDIGYFTARSGGDVTSQGASPVTARGVCWSTQPQPTINNNKTTDGGSSPYSFSSYITGLSPNTTYHVRAYATNSVGTGYGNELSFTTLPYSGGGCGTVTDREGNVYQTVTIGTQCWMAENLKTNLYNDGNTIANVPDNTLWENATGGAFCWYNNDVSNNNAYGKLYNWYAVNTGKLAPAGWHVPTDAEWQTLIDYLGGSSVAGSKMKAVAPLWDGAVTDNSGFKGLPGGYRYGIGGSFIQMGTGGSFWSSSVYPLNTTYAINFHLQSGNDGALRTHIAKNFGLYVRCVKD